VPVSNRIISSNAHKSGGTWSSRVSKSCSYRVDNALYDNLLKETVESESIETSSHPNHVGATAKVYLPFLNVAKSVLKLPPKMSSQHLFYKMVMDRGEPLTDSATSTITMAMVASLTLVSWNVKESLVDRIH
jgi:hypothetical protein